MSKPRGEGPSPPFSIAPKSFPVDLFVTMPVLVCPSLEESYPSLAKLVRLRAKQGKVKWAEAMPLPGK